MVYLDRSLAPGGGAAADAEAAAVCHDFVPAGCPQPAAPRVHLLYRPGHYVRAGWVAGWGGCFASI